MKKTHGIICTILLFF